MTYEYTPHLPTHDSIKPGLQEDSTLNGLRGKFYTHPNAPGYLVRKEDFEDVHSAQMSVHYSNVELNILARNHGVSVVNHEHAIGQTNDGVNHYILVPRLEGVISVDQAMQMGATDPSIVREIDNTATKLLNYIGDTMRDGGVITNDHLSLRQFVFSPTQPEGKRMIMVDIEATYPEVVAKAEPGIGYQSDSAILALVKLGREIAELKNSARETPLKSETRFREVLDIFPSNTPSAVRRAKEDMVRALERGDSTIFGYMTMDSDDTDDTTMQYWRDYQDEGRTPPEFAASFASRELVDYFIATGKRVEGRELTTEERARVATHQRTLAERERALEGRQQSRERGDEGQSPRGPVRAPLHDEFGRPINQPSKERVLGDFMPGQSFGGRFNSQYPQTPHQKERVHEQVREIELDASVPDKIDLSHETSEQRDARLREQEAARTRGRGIVARTVDLIREHAPGLKNPDIRKREANIKGQLRDIADAAESSRQRAEHQIQQLARGLEERGIEPNIIREAAENGVLLATANDPIFQQSQQLSERSKAAKTQEPRTQERTKELELRERQLELLAAVLNPGRFKEPDWAHKAKEERARTEQAQRTKAEREKEGRTPSHIPRTPSPEQVLKEVRQFADLSDEMYRRAIAAKREKQGRIREELVRERPELARDPEALQRALEREEARQTAEARAKKLSRERSQERTREPRTRDY